jgi:hypothetical protein
MRERSPYRRSKPRSWACSSATNCWRCAVVNSQSESRWRSRHRTSFASIADFSRS